MINAGQSGYEMGAVPFTVRPLMPSDLQISMLPNEFDVQLSWSNPTENTDGSPLTTINGVLVYRNGQVIADLTDMTPGAFVQYTDTVPEQGEYRYQVLAYTTVNGLYCFTRQMWIGPPSWAVPTGPDAYGYLAYESLDPGGPTYDWIEIAPSAGGSGSTVAELTGEDDRSTCITLPFTFQYYGLEYNQITICTNGWLAFGDATPDSDFSNSSIPNADGPSAMLAPFWEDMNLENGGEIATEYDAVAGIFVVEFFHIPQWSPANTYETFEVVLYDPSQHPTVTGDGEIRFQYFDITDPTEASFGIENQAEAVGLQMGYNNSYPQSAAGIQDNYAILFQPPEEAFPVEVTLTPEAPPVIIPAGGGAFNYTIDLSAPTVTQTFDVWIDVVLPAGDSYGPLMSRELVLSAGQSLSRDMTQNVPGNAPQGQYLYRAFIGDEALGVIWSEDSFAFTKEGMTGSALDSWQCQDREAEQTTSNLDLIAADTRLLSAAPNPFNPETTIRFYLPEASHARLEVFNSKGSKVATLADGWRLKGMQRVKFDGSGLSSGIYIYRLTVGNAVVSRKMILLK